MKRMRPYSDIYNFVMMIMTFIAAAVLVQKGFWGHLDPWVGVLRCSPCLLAYIAGRFLHGRNPIISLITGILLSLALSAVSVMLVWKADIYAIIGSVLVAPGTFLMFMAPFAHGSAIMGSARFITGIAIFLVAIIAGGANNEIYRPTLNTMAILYLVAGLYIQPREPPRRGKFNLPSSGKVNIPGHEKEQHPDAHRTDRDRPDRGEF